MLESIPALSRLPPLVKMKVLYLLSAAATASGGSRVGSVSRAFRGLVPGTKATIPRDGEMGTTSYVQTCGTHASSLQDCKPS